MTSPIRPASHCVKNSRPSDIGAMQRAPLPGVGMSYSPSTVPSGAMRPILLAKLAVYQRSPSAPTVTPRSDAFGVGTLCSVMLPSRSMRPSALVEVSTNQIEPSGCVTIARGWLSWLGIGNSVTLPSIVMRPTREPAASLNHSAPSRTTIDSGLRARRDAVLELGDFAVRRDAADLAHFGFGEPDVAVGAELHGVGAGVRRRQREFRDLALRRDAADLAGGFLGEPEIAVGADDDADRRRVRRRQVELLEGVGLGIEPADLRGAALAEPQAAVAAFDRDIGLAARGRDPVLADGGWRDGARGGTWLRCAIDMRGC